MWSSLAGCHSRVARCRVGTLNRKETSMRILKRILIGLFVIIVVLAGVGLLLPRKGHVERSTIIDPPRAPLFAVGNSFKMFNPWSPRPALDPHAEYHYEGPVAGGG